MPRGFSPTFSVATTLSVAVSMTDTEALPSLETYASAAAAPRELERAKRASAEPRRSVWESMGARNEREEMC